MPNLRFQEHILKRIIACNNAFNGFLVRTIRNPDYHITYRSLVNFIMYVTITTHLTQIIKKSMIFFFETHSSVLKIKTTV